jgi:DnaJ-class molecular chaperone
MDAHSLEFERQCDLCEGTGALDGAVCHKCRGTLEVPTKLGEAVLRLIRNNLRAEVKV